LVLATSSWEKKNYDQDAFESFTRNAMSRALSSEKGVLTARLASIPVLQSDTQSYAIALALGSGLFAAAFTLGKRAERAQNHRKFSVLASDGA
jgi:hypothetical protein